MLEREADLVGVERRARDRDDGPRDTDDEHRLESHRRAEHDETECLPVARGRFHQQTEPPYEKEQASLGQREGQRDLKRQAAKGLRGGNPHVVHGASACYATSGSRVRGTNASVNAADVHLDQATLSRLHALSGGAAWGVSREALADAIGRSVAHRFDTPPSTAEAEAYLASLHVADLALACACRAGNDSAWEHLVRDVRPALYASARTIAGDEGRELADSLYAELYGLPGADGQPRSLLAYFHGRSRLITWLRSVMVQRLIDRRRQSSRLTPLDESADAEETPVRASLGASDPHRDVYVEYTQRALDEAIDAMAPKDRIRLRLYYGQDLTLARIGRLLGESEATVSRRVASARRALRADVEQRLRNQHGMSDAAVQQCFEYAASAPEMQLDRLLTGAEDS